MSEVLIGIPASSGVVIGEAVVVSSSDDIKVGVWHITDDRIDEEISRLKTALKKTKESIKKAAKELKKFLNPHEYKIIEAHSLILEDPLLNDGVIQLVKKHKLNAEGAVYEVMEDIIKKLEAAKDEYIMERVHELKTLRKKIIGFLIQKPEEFHIPKPCILVSYNILPSDTLVLKEKNVIGIVTEIGGKTSHVAIIANSLEIPAICGIKGVVSMIKTGDQLILDAETGRLIINPEPEVIENYRNTIEQLKSKKRKLEELKWLPAETLDGRRIVVSINIDSHKNLKLISEHGADGIGLLRTEYIFIGRDEPPSLEKQVEIYKQISNASLPNKCVIRTLDIGADKLNTYGYTLESVALMGVRGIRILFKDPEIYRTQIKAILMASKNKNVRILFPMVTEAHEMKKAVEVVEELKNELTKENYEFDKNIEIGAMIEVPSSVFIIDELSKYCDYFSIGTNDLMQYVFAVDRSDIDVQDLLNPFSPVILKLIDLIIQTAHKNGKKVSICGNLASEELLVPFFVGAGIDELAVVPMQVEKLKMIIRALKHEDAANLKNEIMSLNNAREIRNKLKKFFECLKTT
ncbi:MAG: phosphoenolpyruvate--protein phosphotransferase [bacterium]|nr:phosphoenolpyruvate--protein phosphotransferase [bacterium]